MYNISLVLIIIIIVLGGIFALSSKRESIVEQSPSIENTGSASSTKNNNSSWEEKYDINGSMAKQNIYGKKVRYKVGVPIIFPDFSVTYVGSFETPVTPTSEIKIISYKFLIQKNSEQKEVVWASLGEVAPADFDFQGKKYSLERVLSNEQKLESDEVVVNKL